MINKNKGMTHDPTKIPFDLNATINVLREGKDLRVRMALNT
jgi:hypothetical protein